MNVLIEVLIAFTIAILLLWALLNPAGDYYVDDREYDDWSFWRGPR